MLSLRRKSDGDQRSLLAEFDHEMENTGKLLERVPDDKLGWKPHEKSMALGRLASHIAELPGWAVDTIRRESLDIPPDFKAFLANSRAELTETFKKNVAEARAAIAGVSDEDLGKTWTLKFGGREIFSLPRAAVLRNVVMNHLIHHRAQLGVYLRLNNVAIPGMYGPSADEQSQFTSQSA